MNIQLSTGKTIYVSAYDYFFVLKDEDVDQFYQSCIADDLGQEINNPFSNKKDSWKLEVEEEDEEE